MPLIVTNQAKVLMLEIIMNKSTSSGDRRLKLFVNNIVPTQNTTLEDLTECTSTGYVSRILSGSGWAVETVDGITSATHEEQVFEIEEELLIYGYYVTNDTGTELLWVERFTGAPYSLPTGGGSIGIELSFTLS